jgi:hypothetical protein
VTTQARPPASPPAGAIGITVPGDLVLVREASLAVWAGAVTAFPQGFEFTLLTLADLRHAVLPAGPSPRHAGPGTWLEIHYADGRARSADLDTNSPPEQPEGPHLTVTDAIEMTSEGWNISRWWVTPLPPQGLVEITVHLGGDPQLTGAGHLDGRAIAAAALRAGTAWPDSTPE